MDAQIWEGMIGRAFFEVALPLARPAVMVGLTLALLETLNDFGTVDYFAVRTLTAGIFDVWYGMGNAGGAAQVAVVMLVLVLGLITLERFSRRRQRFHHTTSRVRPAARQRLSGWAGQAAAGLCALPIIIGFLLPGGRLAYYAVVHFERSWSHAFLELAANSLTMAAAPAMVRSASSRVIDLEHILNCVIVVLALWGFGVQLMIRRVVQADRALSDGDEQRLASEIAAIERELHDAKIRDYIVKKKIFDYTSKLEL